ncbi:DMT family transporter [Candidatus Pacearchaeota archaeon]|nr:DMT family transporter [Candidatus Pacearchaeota archaeon]
MERNLKGYLYLSLCIIFWASIPVASKKILVELNNLQMLFYSTIFSFLVLGIILLVQKKHKLMKNYSRKDYLNLAFLGFLGTYLYYVLLYGALALTSAQEGFILAYTWPILVLILTFIILKEQVTIKKIIAILISFIGIIIIVTQGQIYSFQLTNTGGNLLALSGAFVFALFSILGKKHKFDKTVSAFIYFLSALIFITITLILFSSFKIPSLNILMWLLYNGILVNGVTYIWWFKALESVETSILSTSLYLTPFVSLIYIWLFLEETILISSVIGLVIIVAGILIQSWKKK